MCPKWNITLHSTSNQSISARTVSWLSGHCLSLMRWSHSTWKEEREICVANQRYRPFVFCIKERASLWACSWYFCGFLLSLLLEIMRTLWHSFKDLSLTFFLPCWRTQCCASARICKTSFFFFLWNMQQSVTWILKKHSHTCLQPLHFVGLKEDRDLTEFWLKY